MHFTKLRLLGFKSFVDLTEFAILEGVTGIVGPNGCGKSNLLEALRWVMGENRPTQMRGAGMEDVIFQGAQTRAAKSFSEVSLSIDNTSRRAPAAFNEHDEIEITRRITRGLGSSYKLNGKEVRARDVMMMVADAATGAHSSSLVRQGQIAELINAKPEARRRVLEDAAGISGLHQRRHEAELKLSAAAQNLERVQDVLDGLLAQIRTLERQAKTAARYKSLSADLRRAEAWRDCLLWRALGVAYNEAFEKQGVALSARSLGERMRLEAQAALEKATQDLGPLRDEEAIAGALVQRLGLALEEMDREKSRIFEKTQNLMESKAQLERDLGREIQIAADAGEAQKSLEWEMEQLAKASTGEEDTINQANDLAANAHNHLLEKEALFDTLRQDLSREEMRAHSAKKRWENAQKQAIRAQESLTQTQEKNTQAQVELDQAMAHGIKSQTIRKDTEAELAQCREKRADAQKRRDQIRDENDKIRADQSAMRGTLSACVSEHQGLETALARAMVTDPIMDHLEVAPGYEAALGAALGGDLEYPLSKMGTGWRTLDSGNVAAVDFSFPTLAQFVKAPQELARRLAFVFVVDSFDVAQDLLPRLVSGVRLVTQQGDLLRWDGFVLQHTKEETAATQRLRQRNRLQALGTEIKALEKTKAALDHKMQESEMNLAQALSDLDAGERAYRVRESALTDAIRQDHQAENSIARIKSQIEILGDALRAAQAQFDEAETERARAEAEQIPETALQDLHTRVETARLDVEQARADMLTKRAHLDELRKDRSLRQKRLGEVTRERENWGRRLENTHAHKLDLEKRIADLDATLDEASAQPKILETKRLLLETDLVNAQKRLADAKENLASASSERAKLSEIYRTAEENLARVREDQARAESGVEQSKQALSDAHARILQTHQQEPSMIFETLAQAEDLPEQRNLDAHIQNLAQQRERLGPVNLRAQEDQEQISAEFSALSKDRDEIEQAIVKLRRAIADLNTEGRKRLLEAFDSVNANFKRLFVELFGGGTARLELVENDDPLQAGLEIFCEPPGKKLAMLSLLSGGEQTLTALALIFAVFLTNPSPICVLDEVDAPLDDANVSRFCDMLRAMVQETDTRFLVITHHALTMARMDRLFGVTMAEKGVSQLVSVNLKEAEQLVEEN